MWLIVGACLVIFGYISDWIGLASISGLLFWLIICLCPNYCRTRFCVCVVCAWFMRALCLVYVLVYVWFIFGLCLVYVWFMFGCVWFNVLDAGNDVRFMRGLMLFHVCSVLSLLSVLGLIYYSCIVAICLVDFGLDWIAFNLWTTVWAYLKVMLS